MVPGAHPPADVPGVPEDDFTTRFAAAVGQYTAAGRSVSDLARAIVDLDVQRRRLTGPEPGAVDRWKKLIGDWRRNSLPEDNSPEGQRRLGLALSVLGVPQTKQAEWWTLRQRTEARRRLRKDHGGTDGAATGRRDQAPQAASTEHPEADARPPRWERWQHDPTGMASLGVAYLGDVQLDHPGYAARDAKSPGGRAPAVRIGAVVTSDVLAPETPHTSELRTRFLQFLEDETINGLVTGLTHRSPDARWRVWKNHGRASTGAVLTSPDTSATDPPAPVAWARLILAEPGTIDARRDLRQTGFVLYVEPRNRDQTIASPVELAWWPGLFADVLDVPRALGQFLAADLGLNLHQSPAPAVGVWLTDPGALVDLGDTVTIPGEIPNSWFTGHAVADSAGDSPDVIGRQLARSLVDLALHADGYEHLLTAQATRAARARRATHRDSELYPGDDPTTAGTTGPVGRLICELDDNRDPLALEVHRAIDAPGGSEAALPRYVERAHDRQLRETVDRAAADGVSATVVLVGGSSTGKTRACWEAIRRLGDVPGGWRVWHPLDPLHPEAFLEELPRVGPRTVVWLNEAQHYLLTTNDLGERVAGRLRGLLADPDRAPALVVGTIWPQYADLLTKTPDPDHPDPHAAARALLDGVLVPVPETFTGTDLDAVRAAAGADPRLAYALQHADDGEITQYLAGGPALLDRYRSAPAAARAVIEVAMDARRLGHGPALPLPLLEAAAPGYLTTREWDQLGEDWLERALAYTAAPAKGARGPVTRIRPRPGETTSTPTLYRTMYRLADYLEQYGRRTRGLVIPPRGFWEAVAVQSEGADLHALGLAAAERGRLRVAAGLFQKSSESGDPRSALELAQLAQQRGDQATAGKYFRAAEHAATDSRFITRIALMREVGGQRSEAERLLREAARSGEVQAKLRLAQVLVQRHQLDEAEQLYRDLVSRGVPHAMTELARMLRRTGDIAAAEDLNRRAAVAGDLGALIRLVRQHELSHEPVEAEAMVWRCPTGHRIRLITLIAQLREEAGDDEGLRRLLATDLPAIDNHEHLVLLRLRQRAGLLDEGHRETLEASTHDPELLYGLAEQREELGDDLVAAQLYERAARQEYPPAKSRLAVLADDGGDGPRAEQLARQAAQTGEPSALSILADRRLAGSDRSAAERLMLTAADAGSCNELWTYAEERNLDGEDQWERLLQFGLEPDGATSQPWTPGDTMTTL